MAICILNRVLNKTDLDRMLEWTHRKPSRSLPGCAGRLFFNNFRYSHARIKTRCAGNTCSKLVKGCDKLVKGRGKLFKGRGRVVKGHADE